MGGVGLFLSLRIRLFNYSQCLDGGCFAGDGFVRSDNKATVGLFVRAVEFSLCGVEKRKRLFPSLKESGFVPAVVFVLCGENRRKDFVLQFHSLTQILCRPAWGGDQEFFFPLS